jgi:hypothetical protein
MTQNAVTDTDAPAADMASIYCQAAKLRPCHLILLATAMQLPEPRTTYFKSETSQPFNPTFCESFLNSSVIRIF